MVSPLDKFLAERCGLTQAQIETVNLQKMVGRREISARKAASMRTPEGVSAGAYHRVVVQAKTNIEEAIFTLLVSNRLELLRIEDFRRLLDLISRTPPDLDEAECSEVMSLVDALVKRIVTL